MDTGTLCVFLTQMFHPFPPLDWIALRQCLQIVQIIQTLKKQWCLNLQEKILSSSFSIAFVAMIRPCVSFRWAYTSFSFNAAKALICSLRFLTRLLATLLCSYETQLAKEPRQLIWQVCFCSEALSPSPVSCYITISLYVFAIVLTLEHVHLYSFSCCGSKHLSSSL